MNEVSTEPRPSAEVEEKKSYHHDTQLESHILAPPGPSAPPDGGLTAWLQVAVGHLIVFNTWGYIISFGIFQPYYEEAFSREPSSISWIGSIQMCILFFIGTFSGRAFDAGYYRPVLIAGNILQLIGIFTTSVATEYWHVFLSQGVCQGLGCGLVFAPTVANISTYFNKNRAMAVSMSACGGATGGMVFPLMAQQLLPRIGFSWTVRAMGLVVLVTSAITVAIMRTRLPPRKAGPIIDFAAFKDMTYVLFAISMFFTLWATYFAYYYARTFALDRLGGSQSTSFTMLLVINAVGIPGRLIPAYLADNYFGAVNVFIPVILAAAICQFAWIAVDSLPGDFAWVSVYGLFGAAIQGMFPSTLAGLSKDLSKNGTRIGMIFTMMSISALTGPPLAGKLIEASGGKYLGTQIWSGSCLILGVVLLIAARRASLPKSSS